MNWNLFNRRATKLLVPFRPTLEILEARVLLNSPPVLTVPAAQSVAEGASISLIVSASDSDGDTLTFSASGLPLGPSINTTSGLISGYVGYNNALPLTSPQAISSTLSVSDGTYLVSGSLSWSVADTDRLPTIGLQSNVEGTSISLDVHGTDNTGTDTLSYSASNLPAGLSINASTGLITGVINYENASPGFPNSSVSTNMTFSWLANPSPVSVSLSSLTAVAGNDPGSITLGTITTPDMNTQAGDFVVNINWGDGTTDDANVTGGNGTFTITDDHVYETTGTLSAVVSVTDVATGGFITTSNSPTVSAASWTLTGGFVEGAILTQSTGVVVGTIQDSDPNITASAFAVSVTPGDGSAAVTATLTSVGPGEWDVVLSHSYTQVGADTAAVSITGPGGTTHTTNSTADVGQVYAGVPVIMTAGQYVVLNPISATGDTATITLGDSTSTSGTIVGSGPNFNVQGTLTYSQSSFGGSGNTYSVNHTVQHGTQSLISGSSTVGVAPSSLALQVYNLLEDINGTVDSQIAATFQDSNTSDTVSSFSATIMWEDGTSSSATINGDDGAFSISASRTYSQVQAYDFSVILTQVSFASTSSASGSGAVLLGGANDNSGDNQNSTAALVGPGSIPGNSRYVYSISLPAGALSSVSWIWKGAKVTTDAITKSSSSTCDLITGIFEFPNTPALLQPTVFYTLDGQSYQTTNLGTVYLVKVEITGGTFDNGKRVPRQAGNVVTTTVPLAEGGPPGMSWTANVKLIGPGANLGVAQIRVGFIQVVTVASARAEFPSVNRQLMNTLEGSTMLDSIGANIPWYNTVMTGRSGTIADNDSPFVSFPTTFNGGRLRGVKWHNDFTLDLAAETQDTANGANLKYFQEAIGIGGWLTDFGGSISAALVWDSSAIPSLTKPTGWKTATSVKAEPTDLPIANAQGRRAAWVPRAFP